MVTFGRRPRPNLLLRPKRYVVWRRYVTMKIRELADAESEESGGDVQESTAMKKTGFAGDIGDQVVTANEVTFRSGERTRLHEHTYGQLLYVTSGRGVVATEDEEREVETGDLIFFEPGEVHWHGTSRDNPSEFTHLTVVVRDEVGQDTTAVGDLEDWE